MKSTLLCLALVLSPCAAFAGLDITWNACAGSPGATSNQDFTCSGTSDETYALEFEFTAPVTIPKFRGVGAFIDIHTPDDAPLAPFWTLSCNRLPNNGDHLTIEQPSTCAGERSPWEHGNSENLIAFTYRILSYYEPGHLRLGIWAIRATRATPILAGEDYWAFEMRLSNRHRNRVVYGAPCSGCNQPLLISWDRALLDDGDDTNAEVWVTGGGRRSNFVTINGAPLPSEVTPVQSTSWGRLKAMFR